MRIGVRRADPSSGRCAAPIRMPGVASTACSPAGPCPARNSDRPNAGRLGRPSQRKLPCHGLRSVAGASRGLAKAAGACPVLAPGERSLVRSGHLPGPTGRPAECRSGALPPPFPSPQRFYNGHAGKAVPGDLRRHRGGTKKSPRLVQPRANSSESRGGGTGGGARSRAFRTGKRRFLLGSSGPRWNFLRRARAAPAPILECPSSVEFPGSVARRAGAPAREPSRLRR